MTQAAQAELLRGATRYIWWEQPEAAVRRPDRVIAQVMNLGAFEDVQRMLAVLGEEAFRQVLATAEPGWFNERSWTYWWYRLGGTPAGEPVPAMPVRRFDQSPA